MNFLVDLLNECDKIQTFNRSPGHSEKNTNLLSSFPTKQWILHTAGQSLKMHGHGVEHVYETCEVEKTSNVCERWRHMIFSYAISSLLWNQFNGNKEGPIGVYPQRRNQCLGGMQRHIHGNPMAPAIAPLRNGDTVRLRMLRQSGKFSQIGDHDVGVVEEIFDEETGVHGHCRIRFGEYSYLCNSNHLDKVEKNQLENAYASKENGEPLNYVGHNIVAFAVGKRGDILRVAYNHNVLFTSTVDHAEERLIDSLYRDPAAFVQRSHCEILKDKETLDVEKHMQHISVYTSLEPCQQCSGKMHVALVPEVVFCQRDWDIQLHLGEMYEKFRKTRSVPASHFNFPPYEQLATSYYEFQRLIDEDKPDFFRCMKPRAEGDGSFNPRTVAKKTMPNFLCTDDCHDVYERGDFAFRELLKPLFVGNDTNCIQDALDQLVIFHGLNEQCRRDWYIPDPPHAICTGHIRAYRPALNYKQQRILHDELVANRRQWIQLRHSLSCSVTIPFSSRWRDRTPDRKPVSECMVDRFLSPLANIVSVYIPRELNGLLKGNFKVTCADRYSAARLHKMLSTFESKTPSEDHGAADASIIDEDYQKEAQIIEATREAVNWLRDIQKTEQPIPRVRIDIHNTSHLQPEQRVPAFALTASAEVGDTKVRKYFDHLCSFSFKDSKRLPVSERKAPLSIRIFDVPWSTCLDRMWLNFDGRDKFALSKRRLWTVEFPNASQDVKNLYDCVDFTPEDILDEFVQPYTQPIFDHTWFCACDELFHNWKYAAGARVIITDLSAPGVIAPTELEIDSLIKDIDEQCGISVGIRIMSSYSSQKAEVTRLKLEEQGILLFGSRLINGGEFYPVRLDSDHSIYFLSVGSFKVIGSKHVRVCWQPPELPLALYESNPQKELFCYLKITSKTPKYTHHPNHKSSRSAKSFKKNIGDEKEAALIENCKSFFLSFFGDNPSEHLQELLCEIGIHDLSREQQKLKILEMRPTLASRIKDKGDRELLFDFAGLEATPSPTPRKKDSQRNLQLGTVCSSTCLLPLHRGVL